jgi:hypothetical protein
MGHKERVSIGKNFQYLPVVSEIGCSELGEEIGFGAWDGTPFERRPPPNILRKYKADAQSYF